MKKVLVFIFVFALYNVLEAQVYWQDQNSPTDARYYAVSQNSSDMYGSNGLASGSSEKFYHRTGSGSWSQVTTNLPAGSLSGLWALNSGTLLTVHFYISTTTVAFYRSTDHGATWTLVYTVPVYMGLQYNVVQSSDNTIYLVNTLPSQVEDIRKSTDDGVTWITVPNTVHQFKDLVTAGGTALFGLATKTPSWVHTSTDGGVTWTMCGVTGYNLSLGGPGAVFGTPNGTLFLKNYFKSTDGGANWTAITAAPAGPGIRFTDKGNNVFVTNDPTNFFRSTDAGQTYTDVVNGLGLDPSTSMQYIVTPNDGEVYVSTTGPAGYKLYKYALGSAVQESFADFNIEISPNPFSSEAILKVSNLNGVNFSDTELKVFDIIGNEVSVSVIRSNGSFIIQRESLQAGLYMCQLKSGNIVLASTKIIIQ